MLVQGIPESYSANIQNEWRTHLRRVENPIKQGEFQYVRRGIGQSARVPWPQKQKVGGYLLDTTKAVATRRGTRLVGPTLRAPGDQDTEKNPSLVQY